MRRRFSTLVAFGFGLAACNAVLGIEPAVLEPSSETPTGEVSCKNYCALMEQHCTGANKQFISTSACVAFCEKMNVGSEGDRMGDSLACRQSFASAAGASESKFNCDNAGPVGSEQCVKAPCVTYCSFNRKLCGPRAYDADKDCIAACAVWPFRQVALGEEQDRDSLDCRLYHLQVAVASGQQADLDLHCPHTARRSSTCKR